MEGEERGEGKEGEVKGGGKGRGETNWERKGKRREKRPLIEISGYVTVLICPQNY